MPKMGSNERYPQFLNYPSYGFEYGLRTFLVAELSQFRIRAVFERDFTPASLVKLFNQLLACKKVSVDADGTLLDCVTAHLKGDNIIGFCVKDDASWDQLVDKLSDYGDMWKKASMHDDAEVKVNLLFNQATFEHYCALECHVQSIGQTGVSLVSFDAAPGFPLAVFVWLAHFLDSGAHNFFGCVSVASFQCLEDRCLKSTRSLINNDAFVLDLTYAKARAALA